MVEMDPEIGALLLPGMTVTGHFFALSDGSWCGSCGCSTHSVLSDCADCSAATLASPGPLTHLSRPAGKCNLVQLEPVMLTTYLCLAGTLRSLATSGHPTTTPHAATARVPAPCLIPSHRMEKKALSTERVACYWQSWLL
jgi:hypothetical protein